MDSGTGINHVHVMKLTNTQKINACLLATFTLIGAGFYSHTGGKKIAFCENYKDQVSHNMLAVTGLNARW